MRLLLLNQFDLASGAPTGRILSELAAGLRQSGHEVTLISADSTYGRSRRGAARILHELRAHFILLGRSLLHRRVDAVISLTSPACLAVTAGFVAATLRARHFHWAMDLYPDVGVRLGELREGALPRLLTRLMRRAYHQATRVVSLDEDMRDYLMSHYGMDSLVMEPFAPQVTWPVMNSTQIAQRCWLYSGNFGRAHEVDILLHLQRRLEDHQVKAELILQGQGAQFASSRDSASRLSLQQVQWRPPAPAKLLGESLAQSDVIVVTRKPEMKGLLLPSKLMLAELSGKSILWIGDSDGKTAERLKCDGRHGVFAPEEIDSMVAWLQGIFGDRSSKQVIPAKATAAARDAAIRKWERLLREEI